MNQEGNAATSRPGKVPQPLKWHRWREILPRNEDRRVDEFRLAQADSDMGPVHNAVNFFIRCRQSLAGRMKGFTGITKTRTRRGMNNEVSAWLTCIEGLPAVHARLKRVLILNRPALEVIHGQDTPRTLFYLDPPYVHSTRATTGEYTHEMTEADHAELLDSLVSIQGRFMLSGYPFTFAPLAWFGRSNECRFHPFRFATASYSSLGRVEEVVWCNY